MYIVKLGLSSITNYVGMFDTRAKAVEWVNDNCLDETHIIIIFVLDRSEYVD